LGLDLPLDELSDWVVGRLTWHPVDQTPNYDAKGQLHSFSQADWHIEYLEYTNQNGLVLPQKILLKSAQVKVRIFIRAWTQLGVEPPVSSQ
ncbi:MAG: outer membrane lipoprotein LolB, partial [Methylophilaceae bacterium]|nr:outer membrane lipoprotein LolB [Methylophilaceae bacterium]